MRFDLHNVQWSKSVVKDRSLTDCTTCLFLGKVSNVHRQPISITVTRKFLIYVCVRNGFCPWTVGQLWCPPIHQRSPPTSSQKLAGLSAAVRWVTPLVSRKVILDKSLEAFNHGRIYMHISYIYIHLQQSVNSYHYFRGRSLITIIKPLLQGIGYTQVFIIL